jgi:protein-disulfide isomerase
LTVIHLNVQDAASQPLMQRFGFEYTPTFILLDTGGGLLKSWVGAIDPSQVTQALSAH